MLHYLQITSCFLLLSLGVCIPLQAEPSDSLLYRKVYRELEAIYKGERADKCLEAYEAQVTLGKICLQENMNDIALSYFTNAQCCELISAQEHYELEQLRLDAALSGNLLNDAQFILENLLVLAKNEPTVYLQYKLQLVELLIRMNKLEAAESYNRQILSETLPGNAQQIEAINLKAVILAKQGNTKEAQKIYEKLSLNELLLNSELPLDIRFNKIIVDANFGATKLASSAISAILKEDIDDKTKAALYLMNSKLSKKEGDLYAAIQYGEEAVKLKTSDNVQKEALLFLSEAHETLYEYEKAFEYYQQYLKVQEDIRFAKDLQEQRKVQLRQYIDRTEQEIALIQAQKEIDAIRIEQLKLESEKQALEVARRQKDLLLLKRQQEIDQEKLRNKELAALQAQQALELVNSQLAAAQKDKDILNLQQKEQAQLTLLREKEAEQREQAQQVRLLEQNQLIGALENDKQRNFVLAILGILLAAAIAVYIRFRAIKRSSKKIEQERKRSADLLLNILPANTAKELMTQGYSAARKFENATVLFADIKGFTQLSEELSPEELVREIDRCFKGFDRLLSKYKVEKIKTIGDCYMCVAGVPEEYNGSTKEAVSLAVDMQKFMRSLGEVQQERGMKPFSVRIGLHTGPVVAGVVGTKKFAYDIWGDTVNTASRVEGACEVGKVNISESTYNLVANDFGFLPRGGINVKNKGELNMYYVQ